MKFGKKSYMFLSLALLIGIFSAAIFREAKPMKAAEQYSIIVDSVTETGEIPVTLTIANPTNEELKLSFEGISPLDSTQMLAGVSDAYRDKVTIDDVNDSTAKKITIEEGKKSLEIKFLVAQSEQASKGKITLVNAENQELASQSIEFSTKEPESVAKSISFFSNEAQPFLTGNYPGDIGEPGPTTQEMEAANNAANQAIGFNPEANVKTVTTWADLRTYYNDATVTKIILGADISNTANQSMNLRRTSIEIDGAGHTLYLGSQSFEINSPTDGIGFFHIHDMIAQQNLNNQLSGAGRYAFVNGTNFTSNVVGWTFRTGNITTQAINGKRVGRFIRAYQSMIQTYGYMNLITTEENYYAGGMIVEDKTQWRGTVTYANYSAVWYVENSTNAASTSKNMEFTVGKDALVSLKNETTGATYPAVYHHYRAMTIGEGSVYNSNMQGNSVRFDDVGASLTIKANATVNLLSRGTGSVLQFNANTTAVNVEPEGSIYIVGSTTSPIVDMTGGSNKTFTMNSPKGYDIRNRNTGSASNSPAISTGTVQTNIFSINDSDIDLWRLQSELLGPSQQTYTKVVNFSVKAAGGASNVTTSEAGLATFVPTQYRRIAGMNTAPEAEWTPVTDADKSYQVRVKIGMTPTDNFDEDGNVILQPVYASTGQATVTVTDTFGATHTGTTNVSGHAIFTDTKFNTANGVMSAHAVRGPWVSETDDTTTVLDVTPPKPAVVTEGKVTNSTKQLIGTGAEPEAKVYVNINGTRQATVGAVNADGTWTYNLSRYLNTGETVQIFLEDNAPKITETITPAPPVTNTATGNINPASNLNYRDATFTAATSYTVLDSLPDNPQMTKTVVSSSGAATQVGDTLTYTLTATNGKSASLTTVWRDVVITDTIPNDLEFDPLTAEITINGAAASSTDYTYDETTRLLTVKAGDLNSAEASVVTFKTTVDQLAVGTTITNTATALGFSPRETAPFIEGPNDPDRPHDEYSKSASVVNPGGEIFGVLELVSAPDVINFGATTFSPKGTTINNPSYEGDDLVVKDGRAVQEIWTLNAKLEQPLANVDNPTQVIPNAIRYVHSNNELTLTGAAQPILSRKNDDTTPYNVSGTWSPAGDGFKLVVPSGQSVTAGNYEATIVWELVAGPPPGP